jgi:hypothetical protein
MGLAFGQLERDRQIVGVDDGAKMAENRRP